MSELNELRHRGNNDQSDMIKPFTAVLEGKKLRISTSSDDPGTRARDSNMSAMTGACRHDTAVCSDVAAAPRQSDAMCTYLHKPSAPSPLVNTPLSGKKLPILSRTRNDYLFYTPSEEGKLRKGVSMLDSQVDGEPFICCQSVPNEQDVDGRLHKGTIENNSAYNLLCQTKDVSPLTIASISLLPLIKKTVGAVEDNAPSRALNTNAFPLVVAAKNMPESQTNAHTLNPIIDESQISHVKRLHVKPFKVLGTGFRTDRKEQSKAETPTSSKVKYCRGVSYNGANYAYCLHAPYKARIKGVAPELSVCLQYVICYDKKVPQLEKQPTVHKSVIPAPRMSENKKEHDDIVRGKKKRRKSKSSPEYIYKTEKNGVLCRPVTVSDPRMAHHLSLNDRRVAVRRRSSSERRLALHDDFPFHCFLLFQFEDRQKVMKRLTKLPERMQRSLLKKKKSLLDGTRSDVRTKSRHANVTPPFQSHPPKRNSQSVESLVKDRENPLDRRSKINLEGRTNDKVQSKHASREQTKTEDADVEMKLTQRSSGMGEVCSHKPLCDERWRHSATSTDTLVKNQYVDMRVREKKKEDDEATVEAAYCGPHEDRQCVNCIGQSEMGQKESTVDNGQKADSTVSYLRTSESKTSLPTKMATEAGCDVEQTNAD
ncbi:hypothetical protein Btru_029572 [Bulinus truncatus]|nr:hypothetical protein Btru_029572 [Bulinus truncatus]